MPTNKRPRNRSKNPGRGGGSNNAEKTRNQLGRGVRTAPVRPFATAAAVGGAIAAGLLLWSRRKQIGDEIDNLADEIGDWRDHMRSQRDPGSADSGSGERRTSSSRGGGDQRTQREIAEEALTVKETGNAALAEQL